MYDPQPTALRPAPTKAERARRTFMSLHSPTPRLLGALGIIAILVAAGCSGDDTTSEQSDSGSSGDRAAVVTGLVDDVVGPAHRTAAAAATTARTAVHDACPASGAPPSAEVVQAARAAAAAGNEAWEVLDPIDAGPIMERRTGSLVGYKVDPAAVDQVLATAPPSDVETVTERTASPRRGYGALMHLLSTDPATFPGPRCAYATAVVDTIDGALAMVVDDWYEASPSYVDRAAGRAEDAISAQDNIDSWVNMSLSTLESDLKLLADPESQAAAMDPTRQHLLTIQNLWDDDAAGLGSLASDEVEAKLSAELETAIAAADPAALSTAVEAVRSTLGTEVVSALDVTVGFSENDGDS